MTIRWILAMLYCVGLSIGVWWIIRTNKLVEVDFIANRDLPLNYQLQANDVVSPGNVSTGLHLGDTNADNFVGRYVRGALPKGAALRLSSTGTVPYTTAAPGHLLLLVALPRASAASINAEICVRLNIKDQTPFLVQSVLCTALPKPRCPAHDAATPQPAVPCTEALPADCAAVIDIPAARMQAIISHDAQPSASPPPAAPPLATPPLATPASVARHPGRLQADTKKARTKQSAGQPPVTPPAIVPTTVTPATVAAPAVTAPAATPLAVVASAPCP